MKISSKKLKTMLKISLDEAYVFDMMSVFDIKLKILTDDKLSKTIQKHNLMKTEIISQLGEELFEKIISSQEYKNMISTNQKVFDLIDLSKTDNGLAKQTDDANYQRHVKKMALQKKFFDGELTEVKNRE